MTLNQCGSSLYGRHREITLKKASFFFHLLMKKVALELCLKLFFNHHKSACAVTGDGCLVFQAKPLLYSLLIRYCSMENYFSEVKKTSNSFTYDLH